MREGARCADIPFYQRVVVTLHFRCAYILVRKGAMGVVTWLEIELDEGVITSFLRLRCADIPFHWRIATTLNFRCADILSYWGVVVILHFRCAYVLVSEGAMGW